MNRVQHAQTGSNGPFHFFHFLNVAHQRAAHFCCNQMSVVHPLYRVYVVQLFAIVREYFDFALVICGQMFLRVIECVKNDTIKYQHFHSILLVVAQSKAMHFQFQNEVHHLDAIV